MSEPTSYSKALNNWEQFLRQHPNNIIRVKDLKANKYLSLSKKDKGTVLNYDNMLLTHNTLSEFFDELIKKESLTRIYVEFKVINGEGMLDDKKLKSTPVDVSSRLEELRNRVTSEKRNMEDKPVVQYAQQTSVVKPNTMHNPNNFEQTVMMGMGGLGAAGMAAGMGYRELVTMEKKAEMSDYYKSEMERLKKELGDTETECRKLRSDMHTATKDKELAIKEAKLESSSWNDPDKLTPIIQALGPIAANFMPKGQAEGQELGMGASANLSEIKQGIVQFVSAETFSEEQAKIIEGVLVTMFQKPEFQVTLMNLINQQNPQADGATGS